MPNGKQPRFRSICSAAWQDAIRRGAAYPKGMIFCPICTRDQPPIHFGTSGRCFDCSNGIDRTRLARATPAPGIAKTYRWMRKVREVLTPTEIKLLASYLFDRQSQSEIASVTRTRQTTVSAQLRKIMDRCEDAGLPIKRPGRRTSKPAHMPERTELVIIDPATLETIVAAVDGTGRLHGRWSGAGQPCRADAPMNPQDFTRARSNGRN